MKALFIVLPLLVLSSQFASARSVSTESSQNRFEQAGGYMQMMLVWQERACMTAIEKIAQKTQSSISSASAGRGPIGESQILVSAKLTDGQECACVVYQGEEPSATCERPAL